MMLPATITQMRYLMGTLVEVRLWDEDVARAHKGCDLAFSEMHRLEYMLSRFETSSELSQVNRTAHQHPVEVSQELMEILLLAQKISQISQGSFDVTSGPWLKLWERSAQEDRLPTAQERSQTQRRVGYEQVQLDPKARTVFFTQSGIELDLGGIAKGHALDLVVTLLEALGIPQGLVDAGGNFKIFGFKEPPHIGVEHPGQPDTLCGTLPMIRSAVASSNNSLRHFTIREKSYGHVIHPQTGEPIQVGQGTTVLANSAALADSLSTAWLVSQKSTQWLETFQAEGIRLQTASATSHQLITHPSKALRDSYEPVQQEEWTHS